MDDLDQVIVRINAHTELQLLQLRSFMRLVRFLLVLLLDVLVLAVVDDLADGRVHVPSDFNQIQSPLFGDADGLLGGDDAQLLGAINDPDLGCSDSLVDTSLIHESAPVGAVEVVVGAYRLPPVRF